MNSMIAVVAGTGNLPLQACLNLLKEKKKFFIIVLFPEDNLNQIKESVGGFAEICTQDFYKAGEILNLLKKKETKQLLFIGKVDKRILFKKIKLDWLSIKLFAKTTCKSDKSIMETLLTELSNHGIEVIKQNSILHSLLVQPGILTGKLTDDLKDNINFGMQKAKDLSACSIGQTVIVKDKIIIAVEAVEGTDDCILRSINLANSDLIICKTAHENQNKKYDLPTLGPKTLQNLKPGQIKAFAWESDKTFIVDKEEFINMAKKLNITLISVGKDLL